MRAALLLMCIVCAAGAQSPAEDLIAAGHWKKARSLTEARLREEPNDPLALYLASQIHFAFGDAETPLKLAEKALALDGNTAKYHRQVAEITGVQAQHANVFQLLGLARRFKKEIDAALTLDPKDLQALRDLMEFYLLAPGVAGGDKAAAHNVADRIGRLDAAQGLSAQARLADFEKEPGKAETLLRQAAALAPVGYNSQLELAQFELGRFPSARDRRNLSAAEAAARTALQADASRAAAYSVLAEVYAARGEWAELDSLLAAADAAVPDDLTPHYRAAAAMLQTGKNLDAAQRNLRKYLTQESEGNEPALADARQKLKLAQAGPRP